MAEKSIAVAQVVPYALDASEQWTNISDNEWAEMHLFKEEKQPMVYSYRLVAWIPGRRDVIFNVPITRSTVWITAAEDFAEIHPHVGPRYGLYFNTPESASELGGVVTATIESLANPAPIVPASPPPIPPRRGTQPQAELGNSVALAIGGRGGAVQDVPDDFVPPAAPPPPSTKSEAKRRSLAHFRDVEEMVMRATKLSDDFTLEAAVAVQLENIKGRKGAPPLPVRSPLSPVSEHSSPRSPTSGPPALPPRVHPTEESPYDIDGHKSIARPAAVLHKLHVSYDEDLARFVGLPPEWRDMNVQFGVPLSRVPRKAVPGYRERIPCILVMMKEYLFQNGGQHVVGIFRLAPDKDECAAVKAQLNSGTFEGCSDVNIIANLIKVWFRELPECLFDVIPEQTIYKVVDMPLDNVAAEIEKIPEPSRSVTEWLLDLMAEIVIYEHENKMNAKNMAIVMSPNLFSVNSENSMFALTMSQKVADFTVKLLSSRLLTKYNYRVA